MEEHTFVTVNGLRVKIKMSYHIIPQEDDIQQGQRVIGYWPNRVRYYPGNTKGLLTEREVCIL